MALLLAADVIDHQLEEYLRRQVVEQSYGTQERILVCTTPRSNAELSNCKEITVAIKTFLA